MTQFEDVLETILEEYARRDSEGEFDTWEETDAFVKEKAEVLLAYAKEEPVSEELKTELNKYIKGHFTIDTEQLDRFDIEEKDYMYSMDKSDMLALVEHFTNWQKTNLWKPADGEDLPEYDREVIVLVKYSTQRNIHDEEYPTYRVGFGHRPDPKGWDGKSVTTGKVEHYTPKTYDKGGWNMPDVVLWLDLDIPKIEED